MTDETPNPTTPDAPSAAPSGPERPAPASRPTSSADVRQRRPDYKGSELDPERGPGLGCFWFQVIVLAFFIVLIPIGLNVGWPFELLAFLLFVVIGLLLITGQTVIFLLRLVAADRRSQGRRRPLASASRTVGELEDEQRVAHAVGGAPRAVVAGGDLGPHDDGEGPAGSPPIAAAEGHGPADAPAATSPDEPAAASPDEPAAELHEDRESPAVEPAATTGADEVDDPAVAARTDPGVADATASGGDDDPPDAPPAGDGDGREPEEPDPGVRQ